MYVCTVCVCVCVRMSPESVGGRVGVGGLEAGRASVCEGGGGEVRWHKSRVSQSQWGQSRGGRAGREFSFLTAWWIKLSLSLLVLARRLLSLLPDGRRLKKPCVGWVGSPAIRRALRDRHVL